MHFKLYALCENFTLFAFKCIGRYRSIMLFVVMMSLLFTACKKEEELPPNPYDKVNYNTGGTNDTTPDPYSITGLHKNIFSVKCAFDACHGGKFEPDFRTVQSSYASLVYHLLEKSTLDSLRIFTYRVIPYDTANSWLHERLTTPTTEYMPSNGVRLSQAEIQQINTWIMNGAKDINGNIPPAPNKLPEIGNGNAYYVAMDSAYKPIDTLNNRVDSQWFNPFIVQPNMTVNIAMIVDDDSTEVADMQLNQMKFSLSADDFSSPVYTATATYVAQFDVWLVAFNTNVFPAGSTVYFRYYINDGDNAQDVEFPNSTELSFWKTHFAFYIQ